MPLRYRIPISSSKDVTTKRIKGVSSAMMLAIRGPVAHSSRCMLLLGRCIIVRDVNSLPILRSADIVTLARR